MPLDVDYGRDIAQQLRSGNYGWIDTIEFTYDAYLELDQLPSGSWCKISPNNLTHIRETRADWRIEGTLILTLVSAAGINKDPGLIDDWLNSWDQLVEDIKHMRIQQRHRVSSVDYDERYDAEMFHSHKRLVTQVGINFLHLEPI